MRKNPINRICYNIIKLKKIFDITINQIDNKQCNFLKIVTFKLSNIKFIYNENFLCQQFSKKFNQKR